MNNNPDQNKTSIGMDANLAGLLSYLIGIIGIVILVTEKENKFAKFHALQALLFHISMVVFIIGGFILLAIIGILVSVISAALGKAGAIIGMIASIVIMILWIVIVAVGPLAALGGNIYGAIQAYNGKWFRIPVIGNLSAKFLGITIP